MVEGIPEKYEQAHLNPLKQDVATVNKKFEEWTARNNEKTRQQLQRQVVRSTN